MGLDDNLLNRGQVGNDAALNVEDFIDDNDYDDEDDEGGDEKGDYFSSGRLRALKQLNKEKDAAKKAENEKSQNGNPAKKTMANLLQKSWLSVIPSFGLALFWINVHVFLHFVFDKKLFCGLGEEWNLGGFMNTESASNEGIKKDPNQKNASENKSFGGYLKGKIAKNGKFEYALLFLLDILVVILIIAAFSLIVLLINAVSNPIKFLATIIESAIWNSLSK